MKFKSKYTLMTMFLNTLKYTFKIALYFEKFYFKIHFN